jgi:membrane protein YdbS with pleckstrin-like domain
MAGEPINMTPLDSAQMTLLRVRAAISAGIMLVPLAFADFGPLTPALAAGAILLPGAVLLGLWAMLMPRRRYRSWGYAMDEDELHIQHGVWTRTRTIVPFGRVQHIDVSQGPLERRYGLGTLILHTAGTRSSAVDLPGLRFEEAGRMRDEIRAKIRQDLL